MTPIVLAITGASGAIYGVRLLQTLIAAGQTVELTISPAATEVLQHELGLKIALDHFTFEQLLPPRANWPANSPLLKYSLDSLDPSALSGRAGPGDSTAAGVVHYHNHRDYRAGIASGSFLTKGMVICPCSMGTLSGIAHGQSSNLVHRAADVHLKERRKLIVVPRETPLSSIALGNMQRLSEAGAVILPAMPGLYHEPTSLIDLVDFVVARICDQLGVPQRLTKRWSEDQ